MSLSLRPLFLERFFDKNHQNIEMYVFNLIRPVRPAATAEATRLVGTILGENAGITENSDLGTSRSQEPTKLSQSSYSEYEQRLLENP
jgi:hypothetical protein